MVRISELRGLRVVNRIGFSPKNHPNTLMSNLRKDQNDPKKIPNEVLRMEPYMIV